MRWFFVLLILMALGPGMARAEEVLPEYHVSPTGQDDAAGTADAPLKTLSEAVQRLRGDKTAGEATVWLHGGVHRLDAPLEMNYRDRDGIAFRAMPGETPVITGDAPVTGWTETTLHGATVWTVPYEGTQPRALYSADGARTCARWPKKGTLTVDRPVNVVNSTFSNHRSFFMDPEAVPESLDGAFVRMLHWWRDELSGVRGYDTKTGKVTMNRATALTVRAEDPVWFENVLGAPFVPGEWAYDAAEKCLYYAPLPGETPENTALSVGMLERLITIDGVSGITFDGITFARTAWSIPHRDSGADFPQAAYDADAAVYLRGGKDITFTDCTFRDIGAGCIRLDMNTKDAIVRDCTFEEIGAHALYIKGRNTREESGTTARITIENNYIGGYGRHYLNACAVLIIHASDIDIRNNEIHDGTYTAISAGWVWGTGFSATDAIRIEDNLLYDIGQGMLADMGAVYLLGVQKNTVVAGNVIHDVHAAEYGGWGIYLDEGASGITVERNLAYRCSSQGFHQHNGVTNLVRNNVFAYSALGQIGTSDKRAGGTFVLEGNLLVGEEPFFWRKYDKERIEVGDNLFYTDQSPFIELYDGVFALIADPAFDDIGFVPWENQAGRRSAAEPLS